jgi:hypothetical protein
MEIALLIAMLTDYFRTEKAYRKRETEQRNDMATMVAIICKAKKGGKG